MSSTQAFWKGRKVLVTGAGGFIGSHLCEALIASGADVTAMVHYDIRTEYSNLEFLPPAELKRLKVISGDVCDPFFTRQSVQGMDTVFHLAALIAIPYSYVAPQSYVRVNVEGTLNIAEACRSEKVRRLVHTSTSETYGTAIYTPIDEKHPLQGQSPYSASKIGADKIIESYFYSFNLPAVTLRPFNAFGPRQSARAVIPTLISQLLSNVPTLRIGNLTPVRDFNYVKDTVAAFMAVAEHDSCLGKTLNAGSGRGVTIGETAELIMKLLSKKKTLESDTARFRPDGSEVFELICDSTELQRLTPWKPSYTLEQGLTETIAFIEKNLSRFRVDTYAV